MTLLNEKTKSIEAQRKLRHELSTIESSLKSSLRLANHDSKNQVALELMVGMCFSIKMFPQ